MLDLTKVHPEIQCLVFSIKGTHIGKLRRVGLEEAFWAEPAPSWASHTVRRVMQFISCLFGTVSPIDSLP